MRNKTVRFETKAAGDAGTFEALVSVFGNVDHQGDRILKGAYANTLERWRSSGDPVPIVFNHNWSDPMSHIGFADANDVSETDRGLVVKGQLDIDENPVARQVHKLLKRRSLREFSIGYTVPAGGEKRASDGANEISELDLIEAGPTLKGANPATELAGVKSALTAADSEEDELWRRSAMARLEMYLPTKTTGTELLAADLAEKHRDVELIASINRLAGVKGWGS